MTLHEVASAAIEIATIVGCGIVMYIGLYFCYLLASHSRRTKSNGEG